MKMQQQNVYLLEKNTLPAIMLKNFLRKKFKDTINIFLFNDGTSLVNRIDAITEIVIIDFELRGKQANELIRKIKAINPNTKVIVLASDKAIVAAIYAHRKGTKNRSGKGELKRIHTTMLTMLHFPIRIMQRAVGFYILAVIS